MSTTERSRAVQARVGRFNRVVGALLRRGVPIGPMRLLTVSGRRSGQPRTTPVSIFDFEGGRYIMQGFPGAAWVGNARAAGWGLLGRGRRMRRVTLTEVPADERRPMLRHVGGMAPRRLARMFVENGLVASTDPEAFAAAAPTVAVFRVGEE
jgi:deazaflavin-dependent oxidoreductase (nitroreductase family)